MSKLLRWTDTSQLLGMSAAEFHEKILENPSPCVRGAGVVRLRSLVKLVAVVSEVTRKGGPLTQAQEAALREGCCQGRSRYKDILTGELSFRR
jgi:hypothetical protein